MLAVVTIVEDQIVGTRFGYIVREHFVGNALHLNGIDRIYTGPFAIEFACTPRIESQRSPAGLVIGIDIVCGFGYLGFEDGHRYIVDGIARCTGAVVARCNGDIPCQIEVGAGGEDNIQCIVYVSGIHRNYSRSVGVGIGRIRSLELIACALPRVAIGGVVELHGKTLVVVTIAVFLDIVGQFDTLIIRFAVVGKVCHHVDTACTIGNARSESADSTVDIARCAKVPRAVVCF